MPLSGDSSFNSVQFSFPNASVQAVSIKIWNLTGILIKEITASYGESLSWDGKNEQGNIEEDGVYIYMLKVGNTVAKKAQ